MDSSKIDYRRLIPGIYKHSVSGLVVTWDIRVKHPHGGDYLSSGVIHTIEHTLDTFLRNRYGNYRIVGVFPSGCQTGFYVLTRFIGKAEINQALIDYIMSLQSVRSVESPAECGQPTFQNLYGAQKEMLKYYDKELRYHYAARNYE